MIGEGRLLTVESIARTHGEFLHATLSDNLVSIQSELASEVGVLAKHLFVIVLPEEVGLDEKRDLHVARDGVLTDLLVLWVVDVVNLDVVLRVVVLIDACLNSHWVFADVSTGRIVDRALRQTLSRHRVLIDELSL